MIATTTTTTTSAKSPEIVARLLNYGKNSTRPSQQGTRDPNLCIYKLVYYYQYRSNNADQTNHQSWRM